jgi:hypothetical protein
MNNRAFVLIAVLVVIVILLLLSLYPVSINNEQQENSFSIHQCQALATGCKASIENIQVEIRFPESIVFLQPFPLEVRLSGNQQIPVDKLTVEFKMADMDMALNFSQLEQTDNNKLLWTGKGVLPVCTTGRTDWLAIISIQQDGKVQQTAFQFEVKPSTQ